ncbi:MAG: hypothetical protein ABIN89_30760 [Chitinophagaceae bacterium]
MNLYIQENEVGMPFFDTEQGIWYRGKIPRDTDYLTALFLFQTS